MRSLGVSISILSFFLLLAVPLLAQEEPGNVDRIYVVTPKTGAGQQLEQGLKQHWGWHEQQNDPWRYATWEIVGGENIGRMVIAVLDRRWADFDNPPFDLQADGGDVQANIAPHVESADSSFWQHLPEVSRPLPGEDFTPWSEVVYIHLNMGQERDFTQLIRKIHEGSEKTNWPVHYLWYALVSGGEHPTFALALPRNKWADFAQPEMSFDQMLEEAFGPAEAESIRQALNKTIHCERSEVWHYRQDLSYVPTPEE